MNPGPKAALKPPQSKRSALAARLPTLAERLDCVRFISVYHP